MAFRLFGKVLPGKAAAENEKEERNPIFSAIFGLIFVAIVGQFWPDALPIKLWDLWNTHNTGFIDWIKAGWPILAWGALLGTIAAVFLVSHPEERRRKAEKIFGIGLILSFLAGLFEEIMFRWLIFLSAIITVKIANFFFFGWLGLGLAEWFQIHLMGPIANFLTAFYTDGKLTEFLTKPEMWAIGAAILSTNAFFRDGHKYQGFIGYTNSWFCGMFFFYMTLNYGLLAAMLIHFLYDVVIDIVWYVDMVVERKANGDDEPAAQEAAIV